MDHVGSVVPIGSESNSSENLPSGAFYLQVASLHLLTNYASDLGKTLPHNLIFPSYLDSQISPEGMLLGLDSQLGNNGATDFAAAKFVSGNEVSSPYFDVILNISGGVVVVNQLQSVPGLSDSANGDPGTDTLQLDPSSLVPIESTFQDSTNGTTEQIVTDPAPQDDSQNVTMGQDDTLTIDSPINYTGTISNFVQGDMIVIPPLNDGVFSAILENGNQIELQQGSGASFNLQLDPGQDYSGLGLQLEADENGDQIISLVNLPADTLVQDGQNIFITNDQQMYNISFQGDSGSVNLYDVGNFKGVVARNSDENARDGLTFYNVYNEQITSQSAVYSSEYGIGVQYNMSYSTSQSSDTPNESFTEQEFFYPNSEGLIYDIFNEAPACYFVGSSIAVPNGESPVERLTIGDLVLTVSGEARPVKWIGRRSYIGRLASRNLSLWPIRCRAGSLGKGLPRRDLWVSGDHALFIDGLLIPARHLVNGTTITRERPSADLHYFHIELETHDVILAEGAPAETFLDDDSRQIFHNATEFAALYPNAGPPGRFCAPRVEDGYELEAVRCRLNALAGEQQLAA